MRKIRESVRSIIEFIYREGDIDSSLKSAVTMQEGTQIHKMLQSQYVDFDQEVYLKKTFDIDEDTQLILSGRADGIKDQEGIIVIDEIKSTFMDLEDLHEDSSFLHWAQASIYGALYSEDHGQRPVTIQLTYYSLKNEATKVLQKHLSYEDLQDFLTDTIKRYAKWAKLSASLLDQAVTSAKTTTFPFGKFRPGQDTVAKAVYATIRDGENMIVEAPTGIGKTLSTLFPSVKALGESHIEKVFYLTSKTVHRVVALDAFRKLFDHGLSMVVVGLQAKEKMCINDVFACQPHLCPYAKGHFDRVNEALFNFLGQAQIETPETMANFCLQEVLCPFEFALDVTSFAQAVVCDYNYYFDPFIQLKRHFSTKQAYTVLVDEAHNLHERARDMYSGAIDQGQLKAIRKKVKDMDRGYYKALGKVNSALNAQLKSKDDRGVMTELSLALLNAITRAMSYFLDEGRFSDVSKDQEVLDHFFEMNRVMKLYEYYDERFIIMSDEHQETRVLLRCLDPSHLLEGLYDLVNNVICFSATLSPLKFYQEVLGHGKSKRLQVGSPFDVANRLLIVNGRHSTYAKDRDLTVEAIFDDCKALIDKRVGNYLVFCPSYAYMSLIAPYFETLDLDLDIQASGMTEAQRQAFIDAFKEKPTTSRVGLVVMGGVFSEGIDLHGDRITGVIIIGVGLPTLSKERQIMRAYYDQIGLNGFDYAFTFPGLNKVYQAGGRLIRTETDKGVLMLVGKRFAQGRYLNEFPGHWRPFKVVLSPNDYHTCLALSDHLFRSCKKS